MRCRYPLTADRRRISDVLLFGLRPRTHGRRTEGRAHHTCIPSEEELARGAAHGTLARSHPDARVQLRLTDGPRRIESIASYILAPADDGVVLDERTQLVTGRE